MVFLQNSIIGYEKQIILTQKIKEEMKMKKAIIVSLIVTTFVCLFLSGCNNAEDGMITDNNTTSTTKQNTTSTTKPNDNIDNAVTNASNAAGNAANNVGEAASDIVGGVGEAASNVADGVGKGFKDLTN